MHESDHRLGLLRSRRQDPTVDSADGIYIAVCVGPLGHRCQTEFVLDSGLQDLAKHDRVVDIHGGLSVVYVVLVSNEVDNPINMEPAVDLLQCLDCRRFIEDKDVAVVDAFDKRSVVCESVEICLPPPDVFDAPLIDFPVTICVASHSLGYLCHLVPSPLICQVQFVWVFHAFTIQHSFVVNGIRHRVQVGPDSEAIDIAAIGEIVECDTATDLRERIPVGFIQNRVDGEEHISPDVLPELPVAISPDVVFCVAGH